jgi:hypothetical protein
MGRASSTYGEESSMSLEGKSEGKRHLGRPRRRWEDNIKTDIRNRMGWYGLDSSGSGYGPLAGLVKPIMNLRIT